MSKRKEKEFSPFRVTVHPEWHDLLKDYNLINDDEAWKQLDKFYSKQSAENNVFEYGISFTVLKSDNESELIYNNNWKTFHSKVNFRERIEGVKIPDDELPSFPFSPELWVKNGYGGYEIGITTSESRKKIIMPGENSDLVKITTIPYSLFGLPRYKLGVLKPKKIEEQLKKNGWSKDETLEKYYEEDAIYRGEPIELKHKYFTVWYNYI
jgi:hypothetical protein